MKIYIGRRKSNGGAVVEVIDPTAKANKRGGGIVRKLPLRLDLAKHSPPGFNWGYSGGGAAQLALAILADCLGDDERALRLHQQFKFKIIAKLERDRGWHMNDAQIRRSAVAELEAENAVKA